MKLLLLLAILACLSSTSAYAQLAKQPDDKLDKQVLAVNLNGPQMITLEMKQELKLTEEQYAQVEQLNEQRYTHLAEAEASAADEVLRMRKFREINLQMDKALTTVLTEAQLKHFLELEGRQNMNYLSGKDEK